MPPNTKSDIKELHSKTNQIAVNLASLSGELKGTLDHLATKSDIGEIVSEAIDRQVVRCSSHFQPKGAPAPTSGNPKTVAALSAAITAAVGALVAVIYKLIG